jgi:hypothetical protein
VNGGCMIDEWMERIENGRFDPALQFGAVDGAET